jgi:transferase CAF17, mitochondrial
MDTNQREGFYIDYDSRIPEGLPLESLLKRYILRSKVRIRDASQEFSVWAAWDPHLQHDSMVGNDHQHREWTITSSHCATPVWPPDAQLQRGGPLRIEDRRAIGMGSRFLVPKDHNRE